MNRRQLFKTVLGAIVAPFVPVPEIRFKDIPLVFDTLDVTRMDVFDEVEYQWKEVAAIIKFSDLEADNG